jgi:2-polyprenyl-3-methyl-5-hydroxy-6-metoxy-1,4-benzoquinol methylase
MSKLTAWLENIFGCPKAPNAEITELKRRLVEVEAAILAGTQQASASRVEAGLWALSRRVVSDQPNINYMTMRLRDYEQLTTNVKTLSYYLARDRLTKIPVYDARTPPLAPLNSKICTQADMESDWMAFWCAQMGMPLHYHRKLWEFSYIAQALWAEGKLGAGMTGLGFGCGDEPLPSLFAKYGVDVTATDMEPERMMSAGWVAPDSGAGSLANIRHPHICPDPERLASIQVRHADMNAISEDLSWRFDFCWSACAFEHLGSLAKGVAFVENSLKVLKPGGVAVHTTELNLSDGPETIDNWPTVLFQKKHFEQLAETLRASGHHVAELDFDIGDGLLDGLIDVPPFKSDILPIVSQAPHLRVSVDGFPCTSVGIIVRKAE